MKLTYRKVFVALLGLTSFAVANMAQAREGLFRMNTQKQNGQSYLVITALDNDIRISDLIVNRGNCKPSTVGLDAEAAKFFGVSTKDNGTIWASVPRKLNYGEVARIPIVGLGEPVRMLGVPMQPDCPKILEVVIKTNKGSETHKW